MNITERIEEIGVVAEACKGIAKDCGEMVEITKESTDIKMILVAQSQILVAQSIILRNIGLNLAKETEI